MSDSEKAGPFKSLGSKVALAVVAVIVVLGLIVAVTSIVRVSTADPSPSSTTDGPDGDDDDEPVSSADQSVCGLEGYETESSLEEAPEATWELVGTVAAPTTDAGPGKVDSDGFRSCYAHTAEGALLAAIGYFAVGSDSRLQDKLPDLIADSEGRDVAIENAAGGQEPSATRIQLAGFRVNSYSGSEAVIDVVWAVTSSGGQLVSFPTALEWSDGDWKIALADDGQFPFAAAPVDNLGGYIAWAGV